MKPLNKMKIKFFVKRQKVSNLSSLTIVLFLFKGYKI